MTRWWCAAYDFARAKPSTGTISDFVAETERLVLEAELVDAGMLENVLKRIYAAPKPLLDQARGGLIGWSVASVAFRFAEAWRPLWPRNALCER